jgi:hypothetical protein
VDIDLDGWCNTIIPLRNGMRIATTWCDGVDNCQFVYNPLQVCAHVVADEVGTSLLSVVHP